MKIATCCLAALLLLACNRRPAVPPASAPPTAAAAPQAGQSFRDCESCPDMVVVPAGTFMMGSAESESGRDPGEGPQRRVDIRRLAVGKFDVTRGQWAVFAASTQRPVATGCAWIGGASDGHLDSTGSWRSLHFPQDDTHPVVCVAWQDAQDYVTWLSQRTSHTYRLLSEAEWEYSARAGTITPFPWGASGSHENANYGAERCCSGWAYGRDQWVYTSPVGAFPPNAFGLYDMHGNVLQWVQDCLTSYATAPRDGSPFQSDLPLKEPGPYGEDLKGTTACMYRMVRGGDWGDPPRMIRSAFRNYGPGPGATLKTYRSGGVGFRVARTPE